MSTVKKLLLGLAAVPLLVAASHPAAAHGSGGTHVFLGFNVGVPVYGPPVYYAPAPVYYYPPPPPVYYAPPPAYYAPPPAVVAPPPPPVAAPQASGCRTFHGDASIDDNGEPFYGTACLQSDGRWHIVGQ
jgi:hypothetical protein